MKIKSFKDCEGREWNINITAGSLLKACRSTGLTLADLTSMNIKVENLIEAIPFFCEKQLNERIKTDVKVMIGEIESFAQEVGAPLALEREHHLSVNWLNATLSNIRIVLQSKMMLNACESAMWSCRFAAGAAFLSLLAAAVALATFSLK